MMGELVRRTTADGLGLLGAVSEPARADGSALVFVHGLGANGFTLFTDELADVLPAAGIAVVRGNLRDSDPIRIEERPVTRSVALGGGAFHRFEDSVEDIGTWIDEASARGHQRVVLFGHSLGSLKALNYLARTGDTRVTGLVLASTADLIAMNAARYSLADRERFGTLARELVAAGRADELMPAECTVGLLRQPVSAGSYEDRFGADAAWDVMDLEGRGSERSARTLAAIRVPILALLGTEAETVAREDVEAAFATLRRAAVAAPAFDSCVIEGANHFYTGREHAVAEVTLGWIEQVLG